MVKAEDRALAPNHTWTDPSGPTPNVVFFLESVAVASSRVSPPSPIRLEDIHV